MKSAHGIMKGKLPGLAAAGAAALLACLPSHAMASAGPARLVKDLSPTTATRHSDPNGFVTSGSLTYFTAYDPVHGRELWRTDGTENGTELVMDLVPGPGSPSFTELKIARGALYFFASTTDGLGLYRSDGTAAGTVRVRLLHSRASYPSPPVQMRESGPWIYFTAVDPALGNELWRTDGTEDGTTVVRNINPRPGPYYGPYDITSSNPDHLTDLNGVLLFTADDGTSGVELWRSDGTEEGTTMVREIHPYSSFQSPPSSQRPGPFGLQVMDGTLYLCAADGVTTGPSLWRSDGTTAGTTKVSNATVLYPYATPTVYDSPVLYPAGNTLFFIGYDSAHGMELWKSDGTAAGTVQVRDIHPGSANSLTYPFAVLGNSVYFAANDGTHGTELWTSDGSEGGTRLVADLTPGTGHFSPAFPVTAGGKVYFSSYSSGETGLWCTDGTQAGTEKVTSAALFHYLQSGVDGQGRLLFAADADGSGRELWVSNGTPQGTFKLRDIMPWSSRDSNIFDLVDLDGTAYFLADIEPENHALWRSDGTPEGTRVVKQFPTEEGYSPTGFRDLTSLGGRLFLNALVSGNWQSWISDGTEAGTVPVESAGAASFSRSNLTLWNGHVYFVGGPWNQARLYRTDGTVAGTTVVSPQRVYGGDRRWPAITHSGGYLYMPGVGQYDYYGIVRSDGTAAGTVPVNPTAADQAGIYPYRFTDVNGTLFYQASSLSSGSQQWRLFRSDGTAQGTYFVGQQCNVMGFLTPLGSTVYFVGYNSASGVELWKSDGTEAGTQLVRDLLPGPDGSSPAWLTAIGGFLYFAAWDGNGSYNLWKSDGTSSGTVLVRELAPGIPTTFNAYSEEEKRFLVLPDGRFLFAAADGVAGNELWISDGTTGGTHLLQDLYPGLGYSSPTEFSLVGQNVFFRATDGVSGEELWQLPLSALGIGTTAAADWALYE